VAVTVTKNRKLLSKIRPSSVCKLVTMVVMFDGGWGPQP
jgi:hypothetical protein